MVAKGAVDLVIAALDEGSLRVAEPSGDDWAVNVWVKQAILLYFAAQGCHRMGDGQGAHVLRQAAGQAQL